MECSAGHGFFVEIFAFLAYFAGENREYVH